MMVGIMLMFGGWLVLVGKNSGYGLEFMECKRACPISPYVHDCHAFFSGLAANQ